MMALAAAFVISLLGLLALALAMARHQRDLTGRILAARPARVFRVAGWLLLAASPAPLIAHWGMLTALPIWCALLSLAAIVLVLAITARGRAREAKKQVKGKDSRSR